MSGSAKTVSPKIAAEQLQRWINSIRDVPDLRWSKVQAVRKLINRQQYDVNSKLDDVATVITRELTSDTRKDNPDLQTL